MRRRAFGRSRKTITERQPLPGRFRRPVNCAAAFYIASPDYLRPRMRAIYIVVNEQWNQSAPACRIRCMPGRRGYTAPGCSSAVRTRSAVFRAPSFRIASARWLSNVLGLICIRKAPCLLEQPSLIRFNTSRSRLVKGF